MTNTIEIDSVTRQFGRVRALDSVSFAVPEHSFVGLLGRNGAGKTTVMSIMAGQDRPTSGNVTVAGHDPFEHAPTLAQISYVRDNQRYPDDYRLHHVLRIAPNFAPNWSPEVAAELVEGFRIPARTPIKKLSRGQLSSVAIVLGLASRAPITLLDEPYLGLDVTARAFFHTVLLRDYEDHPRTVVFSTHLIEESASLFDRVVIMDKGRVVLDAASDEATETAWVMSGTTPAVTRLTGNAQVLSTSTVGGLMSATGFGALDSETRELAQELRVQIVRATLQQLVAAYGANDAASDRKEEVRSA
ncbi:ABC transporter ATP-binding protein [Mycetocola zhadangensis]|uniref:ABC transporter ATP-binding protein n=1 Tax=Mycetocola zhadangensis TaxID=1164595 RepID=A0A3L7J4L8_9MICO|nr:ABC transporter ATP-binding protein [Mycetocola zhadangensis]RLQ84401.1 ABC transporter ATP-binding protein [Mycetocola zhadangensis]GGE93288.1 ABC transporter ATP-binding protein [Mycetocola zhadangensis]